MVKARKFVLGKHFKGLPEDTNLQLEEEDLPDLQDGEALFEAVFLTVDPYMRPFSARHPLGNTMMGEQVAKVVESRNPAYNKGSYVLANFGWRSHTVVGGEGVQFRIEPINEADFIDFPMSLALGTLGMPGATAYLGLMEYGAPKAGDVVLVNAAAGAVGSVVGQVAKIKGCKVIGYAGTDAKCEWLRELGFDHAFNYKTEDLGKTLSQAAPDGVNIYYDNVGGHFSSTVLVDHMALGGRVICVGNISTYNEEKKPQGPLLFETILWKNLTLKGFIVRSAFSRQLWRDAYQTMGHWIRENKLKYKETVTEGFENMPKAFIGLFTGENTGKAIVKV